MSSLANAIPADIVSSCRPARARIPAGSSAGYRCPLTDGSSIVVEYFLFDGTSQLDRAWWRYLADIGIRRERRGEGCWTGSAGEWDDWRRGSSDAPVGRLTCTRSSRTSRVIAMAADTRVLMRAQGQDADLVELVRWWSDAHGAAPELG